MSRVLLLFVVVFVVVGEEEEGLVARRDDGRSAAPASAPAAPPRPPGRARPASAAACAGPGARQCARRRHLQPPLLQLQRPSAGVVVGRQGAPLRRVRQCAQGPIRAPRARARLLLPRRLVGVHGMRGQHRLQVGFPSSSVKPSLNPGNQGAVVLIFF